MHRRAKAAVACAIISALAVLAVLSGSDQFESAEAVAESQMQATAHTDSLLASFDPAKAESEAKQAVHNTVMAAKALRAARQVVVEMAALHNPEKTEKAMQAEVNAKALYSEQHLRASRLLALVQHLKATRKIPLAQPSSVAQPAESPRSSQLVESAEREVSHLDDAQGPSDEIPMNELATAETAAVSGDPALIESRALTAITRTHKAAQAVRNARSVVMRLQELGDTAAAAEALKVEQKATRAFTAARLASAPLVNEARANYEATQGTQIQRMAKKIAKDTWESMTAGAPLANSMPPWTAGHPTPHTTYTATPGVRSRYRRGGVLPLAQRPNGLPWRQRVQRHANMAVARKYAAAAQRAQAAAYATQKRAAAYQARHLPAGAVTAVARYAQKAKAAMKAAKLAQTRLQKAEKAQKKQRAARRKGKRREQRRARHHSLTKHGHVSDKLKHSSPSSIIAGAERAVANSMHVVATAANRHGLTDNTWHTRIADMLRNGQTAEAAQAAKEYAQQRIHQAVSSKIQGTGIASAKAEIKSAEKKIAAVARRHAMRTRIAQKKAKKLSTKQKAKKEADKRRTDTAAAKAVTVERKQKAHVRKSAAKAVAVVKKRQKAAAGNSKKNAHKTAKTSKHSKKTAKKAKKTGKGIRLSALAKKIKNLRKVLMEE